MKRKCHRTFVGDEANTVCGLPSASSFTPASAMVLVHHRTDARGKGWTWFIKKEIFNWYLDNTELLAFLPNT